MNFRIFDEAKIVTDDVLSIKDGETVTVLHDFQRAFEAEAIALAAHQAGAKVSLLDITEHVDQIVNVVDYWSDPPSNVIAAMQNSNVSILTVNETYAFRISHVLRHFVKLSDTCSVYKIDPRMGTWGLSKDDVHEIMERGRRLMNAINGHDQVRITTPKGTDLRLSVKGRTCLPVLSIPGRGNQFAHPIPLWGECNWAPIEDLTEGTVIIDGITEATSVLRVVYEPVEWVVEKGRVVKVKGTEDADAFRKIVETDQGSAVIGELGLGSSNYALYGTESEKGRTGTAHFGLGDNGVYPGGKNRSKIHVDGGIRNVTVDVDGKRIFENGVFLI